MLGEIIYVNLNSLLVKGKVVEIVGDKIILELEDKSKCIILKEQIIK